MIIWISRNVSCSGVLFELWMCAFVCWAVTHVACFLFVLLLLLLCLCWRFGGVVGIIDKMSKPKLVRMFQRKKATGKGLDKVKASRKDQDEREELRKKGIETLDLESFDGGSKGHISLQDLERQDLLEDGGGDNPSASVDGKRRIWKGRKGKGGGDVRVNAKNVREDYSGYSQGVAEVMRKQDDDLDLISDALKDMKDLAGAMNNELEYQDRLISEVQDFTIETSVRTKENARRIQKIK